MIYVGGPLARAHKSGMVSDSKKTPSRRTRVRHLCPSRIPSQEGAARWRYLVSRISQFGDIAYRTKDSTFLSRYDTLFRDNLAVYV